MWCDIMLVQKHVYFLTFWPLGSELYLFPLWFKGYGLIKGGVVLPRAPCPWNLVFVVGRYAITTSPLPHLHTELILPWHTSSSYSGALRTGWTQKHISYISGKKNDMAFWCDIQSLLNRPHPLPHPKPHPHVLLPFITVMHATNFGGCCWFAERADM